MFQVRRDVCFISLWGPFVVSGCERLLLRLVEKAFCYVRLRVRRKKRKKEKKPETKFTASVVKQFKWHKRLERNLILIRQYKTEANGGRVFVCCFFGWLFGVCLGCYCVVVVLGGGGVWAGGRGRILLVCSYCFICVLSVCSLLENGVCPEKIHFFLLLLFFFFFFLAYCLIIIRFFFLFFFFLLFFLLFSPSVWWVSLRMSPPMSLRGRRPAAHHSFRTRLTGFLAACGWCRCQREVESGGGGGEGEKRVSQIVINLPFACPCHAAFLPANVFLTYVVTASCRWQQGRPVEPDGAGQSVVGWVAVVGSSPGLRCQAGTTCPCPLSFVAAAAIPELV